MNVCSVMYLYQKDERPYFYLHGALTVSNYIISRYVDEC